MTLRESRLYSHIRPYVPNALRSLAARFRTFSNTRLAARRELNFGRFHLLISNRDTGGGAHESMYWHELSSPLDTEIVARLQPRLFIDVGANYGFSSLLHFTRNPACRFIVVEPNPTLVPYITHNLEQAGCHLFTIHNAICAAEEAAHASFSIHPTYSQDSRVVGPGSWRHVEVSAVTLDGLTANIPADTPTLIKIDTQGYEDAVLAGGRRFLSASANWLMKIEFGPRSLESQGTNPLHFLQSLADAFCVVELPSRVRFKGDSLNDLLGHPLLPMDCASFETYVRHLAKKDGGYCDLLVLPMGSTLLHQGAQAIIAADSLRSP